MPALLYDLEDDNGAYEEGRAVLAAWPGPHWAETRLEPGKAKSRRRLQPSPNQCD